METSNDRTDPLGIYQLSKKIDLLLKRLDKLDELIKSNLDIPMTEDRIIEITGISKNLLASLRKKGSLRYIKPGREIIYIPSEFRDDMKRLRI